ncbi:hypothetical protein [Streptomyces sp. GC420]|uniref:hypothetical protein n=1 Tax=Streptomyces sp. GC420 TaxID=2697568 RepID=UPI0014152624|nr:hypothetical protein [Streptomyces sp. GC420]NBM17598.1 hypothetical protein [Streptomyces sp. GC420]
MAVGVLLAFCASVCMGSATVLQALGARRSAPPGTGPGGPAQLVTTLRGWPFITGIVLDTAGFLFELVALRSVPLFLVEAVIASSLAVTAVVGAAVLKIRLRRAEWGAVAAVCCGLALLAVAAGREGSGDGDARLRLTTLATSLVLTLIGWAALRMVRRRRSVVLGALAGLSFGLTAIGVRLLPELTLPGLLIEPTVYVVIISGVGGYLMLIEALRSGSVTAATAAMVIGETLWPAAFGVVWLGDTTRPGLAPLAATGFALSLAGAVALARFGDTEQPEPEST